MENENEDQFELTDADLEAFASQLAQEKQYELGWPKITKEEWTGQMLIQKGMAKAWPDGWASPELVELLITPKIKKKLGAMTVQAVIDLGHDLGLKGKAFKAASA